jgi:hypothetical protein
VSELSAEGWQQVAAVNARTYAMSDEDREQWYRDNPVSMFEPSAPPLVQRPRDRAAEAARDAAECIGLGRIDDARGLLAEAVRELDLAQRREQQR